jgi:glutaredoxin 3
MQCPNIRDVLGPDDTPHGCCGNIALLRHAMPASMVSMQHLAFNGDTEGLHVERPRRLPLIDDESSLIMPKVVVYTTPFCPYCLMAKRLLAKKSVAFEEIDVSGDFRLRDELVTRSGGRTTVPQIWIGETHVGGFDDLYALERHGKLDALLAA